MFAWILHFEIIK